MDKQHTVAVVDDDPVMISIFERLLTKQGYDTRTWIVDSSVNMLIRDTMPDVLVLDLSLGAVSGWQVLDWVRLQPETCEIPVIVCSGDVMLIGEKATRLHEMNCEIVLKPFLFRELLDKIASALDRSSPAA